MEAYADVDHQLVAESHVCADCGKQFPRHCDLNKHAKSHSRPFKCDHENCKYHELGWPTAKELDRHVNDKHSASPQTFPCLFQPCPYRSKRESNCKQHMEKSHGWVYVRSKSNAKRAIHHGDLVPEDDLLSGSRSNNHLNPYPSPGSDQPSRFNRPTEVDFVLFADDADQSMLAEDDDETFDGLSPDGTQILPWTSPMTRLRKTESFLERFSEAYNPPADRPEHHRRAALIEPGMPGSVHLKVPASLPASRQPNVAGMFTGMSFRNPDLPVTIGAASPAGLVELVRGGQAGSPDLVLSSQKRKRETQCLEAPSDGADNLPIRHRRAISGASAKSNQIIRSPSRPVPKREEDSDREEPEPPRKKHRPAMTDQFGDNNMPDIFRCAHPEIYNRDVKERFSPCHSDHRDISTLVRHLSRPAHRLQVTDRSVSSFEVEDDDYRHPRTGVCRRCWVSFSDCQEFQEHVATDCPKVSKGKKEKWLVLFNAFTPLVNEDTSPTSRPGADRAGRAVDASLTPIDGTPAGTGELVLAPLAPSDDVREYVPMAEYRRLREENQQFRQALYILVQQRNDAGRTRAILGQSSLLPIDFNRRSNLRAPLDQEARDEYGQYQHRDIAPDCESLVGHMDSQSTDVDPQGLMEDVKTLSRANSGFSSTRSIRSHVHHVPTEEVESVRDSAEDGSVANGATARQHATSIADSGYGTHSKRPSYAQDELEAQIKRAAAHALEGSLAPSSAAAIPQQQQQPEPQPQMNHFADYFLTSPHHASHGLPVGHDKSSILGDETVMSHSMWNDPFAGAGHSQAASQAASLTNLGPYDNGPGLDETPVYEDQYTDLVDFEELL